jgi:demethylmenaquinone methyltransferase/2-methoxy-6-polyprenyl-1,4-benzoquinol methylase
MLRQGADLGRFDVVFLGFGLRYVENPGRALPTLASLLRPGGRLALLEFTPAKGAGLGRLLGAFPRVFFHDLLPGLAGRLGPGREIYDYLSESTGDFLTPRQLLDHAEAAGLRTVALRLHLAGLVVNLVAQKQAAR